MDDTQGDDVVGGDDFRAFMTDATGVDSIRAWARTAGVEPTTLTRQIARGEIKAQVLVALCRAYRIPFPDAFTAAGFISAEEARGAASSGALHDATDRQLVEEMLRRVERREAGPEITGPVPGDLVDGQG